MGKSRNSKLFKKRKKICRKRKPDIFVLIMAVTFIFLYIFAFIKATDIRVPKFPYRNLERKVEKVETVSAHIFESEKKRESCIICCKTAAGVQEIPLEEFLVLALGANIDMEYELETLKAQVVLLRGNCVRGMENRNSNTISANGFMEAKNKRMIDADQLDFDYYSLEELKIVWGNKYEVYYKKAKEAVKQTKGIYAKSGDMILNGNFHAMSGGKTRNGEEILGEEYAYLKSVSCEKNLEAHNFAQTKTFETTETSKLEILERDSSGYVTKVSWNGKNYSGEQIRQALGLASANFEVEKGEHYCITTKGIGHGFGFDQYYANYMAKETELDYMELIAYFYKDIIFSVI